MVQEKSSWHLRGMHSEDIADADAIRHLVGWNQTEADWQRLLALAPDGCFVAHASGGAVGTVTTTSYASRLAWIGMLLVHPDAQRQGIGRRLLHHAMQHLQKAGILSIALDATPAGQPLYRSVGFAPVWELARWQGNVSGNLPAPGPEIAAEIPEEIWPTLVALDCRTFGVARPALLHALAAQSSRTAVLLDEGDGRVLGFGMIRRGTRAQMLGPLAAVNRESAARLLAALCTETTQQPIFWDIPEANLAAVELARSLGFTRQRPLARMVWGADYPSHNPALLYAIADLATG